MASKTALFGDDSDDDSDASDDDPFSSQVIALGEAGMAALDGTHLRRTDSQKTRHRHLFGDEYSR